MNKLKLRIFLFFTHIHNQPRVFIFSMYFCNNITINHGMENVSYDTVRFLSTFKFHCFK